ncbi:MAG: hypothetical protein JWR09_3337, partial [Mucilaginibacter sp.]|nr:hypothetical protein [Mucilaginibacter sp.]
SFLESAFTTGTLLKALAVSRADGLYDGVGKFTTVTGGVTAVVSFTGVAIFPDFLQENTESIKKHNNPLK